MASFKFVAVDPKGKEVSGTIEAGSEDEAFNLIKGQGYFPTKVTDAAAAAAKPKLKKSPGQGPAAKKAAAKSKSKAKKPIKQKKKAAGKPLLGARKVKPAELMVFTRQLATLVDAGLPLVRGLEVLDKQEKNPTMKAALKQMSESINSGGTFAESLVQHPKIFDKLFVNMVRAGELGGVLDTVLLSLSVFMEKVQKIKNKVVSAMVYPCVVLFMAVCIVFFLMIVIIPKFEMIFNDILDGQALPPLTNFVLAISQGITEYLPFTIGGVILIVVAFKMAVKTEKGRYALDTVKLKAPMFGSLFLKSSIARFSRTLGTLMDSGVPVLQALSIVKETSGNQVIGNAISGIHDAVKEGENMAPPMESSKVFPPMVIGMVEVGEETGELPAMLSRIADNFEDEVDNAVASITSVIEPIMIVALAVIVGTIVIALFLPLIKIIQGLNG